jgi:tetratricopeptide (TPR) repeat protein
VAPTTLPAHASLLTGVTPLVHRVHDNVGFRLRDDVPTLAATLKEAGYRTGAFVGSFVLDARFGLARGFDEYSDELPENERGLRERRGEEVLADALEFIGGGEGPFFAFLHFFDPHRPYDPPAPFHPGVPDERARYEGEVRYVDSLLGKLLAHLDANDLSRSTVLVVTADHGESLGEHGEDTHGFFLYQSTLHVPLLLRGPSVPSGVRVRDVVRAIDLAPTALELLGVESPPGIEGVSFLSASGEVRSRAVDAYAETFVPRLHYGWSELQSLRRGSFKLVLAPRSELYDLESDPGEQRNVAASEPGVVETLRAELLRRADGNVVPPEHVDERTLASLRALGYVGPAPSDGGRELPDPKDKVALYREILDLSVKEASEETVRRLAAVLAAEPGNPRALRMYGEHLLDLGRPKEAHEAFSRLSADDFESLYGRGRALAALGETGEARAIFERARTLDPRSGRVLARLAELERDLGNAPAAERLLVEAIGLEPDAELYLGLADLLLSSGREAELARVAGGWKGGEAEAAAAYARGQILSSQGSFAGALVELERAFRLAPEDDNVEQALANALSGLGRLEEAREHYEVILRRSPCYLGALTNRGAVDERTGRVDEALRSYEKAIACDPAYANAYKNLGAGLARKGELSRALQVLRQAQRLAPEDRELAEAVLELESVVR